MSVDCTTIVFGRKDGTKISDDIFWSEHADIKLTDAERKRMMGNVEIQAIKFLEKNWNRDHAHVIIDKMCARFTFRDPRSGELYFTPFYEIDFRVVFRKMEKAYLLIYDLRKVQ